MLEECAPEYGVHPVHISKGDQFKPEFMAISPNNRISAIVDDAAAGGPRGREGKIRRPLPVKRLFAKRRTF
jgi:hypothetical protein